MKRRIQSSGFAVLSRALAAAGTCFILIVIFTTAFTSSGMHLGQLIFNPYAAISCLTLIVNLGLLLYLVSKSTRSEERIWLTLYLAAAVVFSLAEVMQRISAFPDATLFWANLGSIALIAPPAVYLFALAYTRQSDERHYTGLISLLIIATLLLVFFENFTNIIFVNSTKYAVLEPWGYDYRTSISNIFWVILIWYDGLSLLAIVRLIRFYRQARTAVLKHQSLLYAFAISIPFLGGSFTDIALPIFGITNVISFTVLLTTVTALLLIYGTIRYQVLTISPSIFSGMILSLMQEAVVVTDTHFNILYVNDNAELLLGIKGRAGGQETLLGKVTPEFADKFKAAFAHKDTDNVLIERVDIAGANNRQTAVRITSSPLNIADQGAWIMVLTDISQEINIRTKIEHEVQVRTQELHQARAYLLTSLNSLEQGFILVNGTGNVEVMNGMSRQLCNLLEADITGKPIAEVMNRANLSVDLPQAVHKVLTTAKHRRLEAGRSDGSSFLVYITPVVAEDDILGAAIVIENITEEKVLARSRDEFFSIASHELRTPLTTIRGDMSLMKERYKHMMHESAFATLVNDSHDASVRLIDIVNDFLDSSKLEQGKMSFELRPVHIGSLLGQIASEMQSLIQARGDQLVLQSLDDLPPIRADEARLRQIIINLLSNAIRYTDHGTLTVTGEQAGHEVRLHFSDTGHGIAPENQKLLFHKFQQAGDSLLARDTGKGTGLGLYISRLLAEHMHGQLVLEHSEVGKGATFLLTLPVATKQDARATSQHVAIIAK